MFDLNNVRINSWTCPKKSSVRY